jgi:ammonia channel protein AmtB
VLGLCSGAVAGLATITPASGFVTAGSAVAIGLAAGAATYFACNNLKSGSATTIRWTRLACTPSAARWEPF